MGTDPKRTDRFTEEDLKEEFRKMRDTRTGKRSGPLRLDDGKFPPPDYSGENPLKRKPRK